MSTKARHPRCIQCKQVTWRSSGQNKVITTQADVDKVTSFLRRQVFVGDILCNKCRKVCYERQKENVPPLPQMQPSPTDESPGSSPSNCSEKDDDTYELEEKSESAEITYVQMPFDRVVSTHKYCFVCGSAEKLVSVTFECRQQVFLQKRIFIPKGNRCCSSHLIKKRLYDDIVQNLHIHSTTSLVEPDDLKQFLEYFAVRSESTIVDKVGDFSLSEERLKVFTGLTWENVIELRSLMTSMRNSMVRDVTQALVVFLFKLRTGNSNKVIASVLGLEREQQVSEFSDSVLKSFEKDILPAHFGVNALSREELIEKHTSPIAKKMYDINDKLALVFDGTYVHHQKSSNNDYQRRSYSGQKKKPLCKPFTVCTTNGYVVETFGPFSGTKNDAKIMEEVLELPNSLKDLMKEGDICVVDRGFRDVNALLVEKGYTVLMPASKGNRRQLTTLESNESRKVTKVRWVVEAVHGIIGQKYKFLHQQIDNKFLPRIQTYCRVACFLNNKFGKRLESDVDMCDEILNQMTSSACDENSLADEVEESHWGRRKVPFKNLSSHDLIDFPELTQTDLKILFTGSYQLTQTVSYLAEMMDSDNNFPVSYLNAKPNILKLEVKSRHINRKTYKCYIDYSPNGIGYGSIRRYCCDCPNGRRTVGCCSHVAAIIYYLSHARYLSKILRPADILTNLFKTTNITPVINEDSDDD